MFGINSAAREDQQQLQGRAFRFCLQNPAGRQIRPVCKNEGLVQLQLESINDKNV